MGWNVTVNCVLVASKSNRQTFTANSTHEAECVACHDCMEQMQMTTALLEELGFKVAKPARLNCDNNSAVCTYSTEVAEWRTPTLATKYPACPEFHLLFFPLGFEVGWPAGDTSSCMTDSDG